MNNIGVLTGGWEFVWAAYAVVWGGMLLYGVSLWSRYRKPQGPAEPKGEP